MRLACWFRRRAETISLNARDSTSSRVDRKSSRSRGRDHQHARRGRYLSGCEAFRSVDRPGLLAGGVFQPARSCPGPGAGVRGPNGKRDR